jgi:hypothetical protein
LLFFQVNIEGTKSTAISGESSKSLRGRRFVEGGGGHGQKNNSRSLFDSVEVFFLITARKKISEGAAVAGSPNSWIRQ